MSIQDERSFQRLIADELVGSGGWVERPHADVDRETRLIVDDLVGYLEDTQPAAVARLAAATGPGWQQRLAGIVAKDLDREPGRALVLLRGGKKVAGGARLEFCQFKPANDLNADLVARYEANRLTVVLEAPVRKPDGTWGAVDVALFVNGIPVADAELKNEMTGQAVAKAVAQYRYDRDPNDTLLSYRSLVHFAVDTQHVQMATRLAGADTRFLPFNRGSSPDGTGGAGNYDPGDGSHPTSYLWRQVWQRDTWLDLLHRFLYVSPPDPDDPDGDVTMLFPRYHQWDAVTRMAGHAREHGAGQHYLVQHSAGSGKSNTIAWLAHRLTSMTAADGVSRVFDKVVVVTDRRVLDEQLSATVEQFEQQSAKGRVVSVDSSRELAEGLARPSARIITTTLQKFPFANQLETLEQVDGRFAILIDEAHSSQSGDTAAQMKDVLRIDEADAALAAEEFGTYDVDDPVEQAVAASAASRGRQSNLSLFAFTATPKAKTLELFGTPGVDGMLRPFHLYSMRQAVEEGFILDVLQHYTPYSVYWKVATDSDVEVEKSKASAAVAKFANLHPAMIAEKSQIIVEHYREHVSGRIGGRAKAMVVTRSRLAAVRYKLALDRYVAEQGYDIGVVVAFSGKVVDPETPGVEHTESSMNGFGEGQTVRRFAGPDMHLMVVAEKYQTGFDQPLLHTMYVDKKLANVAAVQTLGRLNRIHPNKEHPFVLDFVNSADDIAEAFQPYYEATVGSSTDPQVLYETWQRVEESRVVERADIDSFAEVWFTSTAGEVKGHPVLTAAVKRAADRFAELDDPTKDAVRKAISQFVRLYGFLMQVVEFDDTELERAYPYCRVLLRWIGTDRGAALDLSDELELSHLKLAGNDEAAIGLVDGEHVLDGITGDGGGAMTEEEKALLRDVVDRINERFGTEVTEADRIFYQAVAEQMSANAELQQQAAVNDRDTFKYAFDAKFMESVIDAMEHNADLGKRFLDDPAYADIVKEWMLRYVHRRAAERHETPELDL